MLSLQEASMFSGSIDSIWGPMKSFWPEIPIGAKVERDLAGRKLSLDSATMARVHIDSAVTWRNYGPTGQRATDAGTEPTHLQWIPTRKWTA